MTSKIYFTLVSGLLLLYSSSLLAHTTDSGGSLLHMFTGEHLLTLALAGVFVAGAGEVYRRVR